ncbi:MAG: hypothetical protein HYV63_25065 [Candidatus Schekmanbacteria bacterium]|nr:hypothetical protein [Candidatus Schekmanbacteria bacterium]
MKMTARILIPLIACMLLLTGAVQVGAAATATAQWAEYVATTASPWGAAVNPADGSVLVSGSFSADTVFGAGEPNETRLELDGVQDMFVAKYGSDGALLWAIDNGSSIDSGTIATAVAFGPGGASVWVAIWFGPVITLGAGQENETTLYSFGGTSDICIAKYDTNGNLIFAIHVGGNDIDSLLSISASDSESSIIVSGNFNSDEITFGNGEPSETTLTDNPTDMGPAFIAKYYDDGRLVWAKQTRGGPIYSPAMCVNPADGSIFLSGDYTEEPIFAPGESNETTLHGYGGADIAIAKYGADGSLAWARRAGSGWYDKPYDVAVDPNDGSAVVVGIIGGEALFGEGEANETYLPWLSGQDIFVAKYYANGSLAWARAATGTKYSFATAVAVNPLDDSIIVGGTIPQPMYFNTDQPEMFFVNGEGLFVAKYAANGSILWVDTYDNYDAWRSVRALAMNRVDGKVLIAGTFVDRLTFWNGAQAITLVAGRPGYGDGFAASLDTSAMFPVPTRSSAILSCLAGLGWLVGRRRDREKPATGHALISLLRLWVQRQSRPPR